MKSFNVYEREVPTAKKDWVWGVVDERGFAQSYSQDRNTAEKIAKALTAQATVEEFGRIFQQKLGGLGATKLPLPTKAVGCQYAGCRSAVHRDMDRGLIPFENDHSRNLDEFVHPYRRGAEQSKVTKDTPVPAGMKKQHRSQYSAGLGRGFDSRSDAQGWHDDLGDCGMPTALRIESEWRLVPCTGQVWAK